MSSIGELTFFLGLQVKQKQDRIFISQDKYVAEILKKFGFSKVKTASTPMETQKPLLKDKDGEEVDVHTYRLMIGSLMYLTSSRPDIMFAVCACTRYQVNPKVSHLHAVKRILRYLKGQPKLGLWYPKDSPFDLMAYTDSDYARASLDRKSTIEGCQFLRHKLMLLGKLTTAKVNVVQGRVVTTTFSLEAEHDNDNIDKTQTKAASIEPSSQGTSSGDGPRCQDIMRDTSAHTRVISSSDDEALDKEDTSKYERIDEIDADEDIALMVIDTIDAAQVTTVIADIPVSAAETIVTTTLTITAESTKINVEVTQAPKRKRVMIQEPEETTTTNIASSQQPQVQEKGKLTTAKVNAVQGRVATTTSSLEAEHDNDNIDKTQTKAASNEPSSQGTSSGDGPRCQDTMRDTSAHTRVISSSDDEALDKEDTSKYERIDEIDADEDIALVSTHDDELQDEGIEDVGEEEVVEVVTTVKMVIDTIDAAQVTTVIADIPVSATETIVTTALTITAESTRINIEVTQAPKRKRVMIQEREETTTTNIASSQQPQVQDKETAQESSSKREGDELEQKNAKKQKIEDDKESAELKQCLEIIPNNA
nr:uncharacterized mitochondrial protein AtMg00810-like [Tanacetum cinerariifolium]